MEETNPYRVGVEKESSGIKSSTVPSSSLWRRWLVGALLGATPPAFLGIYAMLKFWESLPPGPACGNGAFSSIFLVFIVSPICGLIGGSISTRSGPEAS